MKHIYTENEGWTPKNWCFQIVVLEKTLESPMDCKEIKPVNPKGNQHWSSLEGLMLKLKLWNFSHLMWKANSLEKTLMLGRIEGKRKRGQQRIRWFDGISNSMNMNLGAFWEMVRDREAWHAVYIYIYMCVCVCVVFLWDVMQVITVTATFKWKSKI